jgi:hypothetical protein
MKLPRLTSIKQLKETLRNYDGIYLKMKDGYHVVDVNLNEMWFESREELLMEMSHYFWSWGMELA